MAADGLVTEGTRASAVMILTQLPSNIRVSAPGKLRTVASLYRESAGQPKVSYDLYVLWACGAYCRWRFAPYMNMLLWTNLRNIGRADHTDMTYTKLILTKEHPLKLIGLTPNGVISRVIQSNNSDTLSSKCHCLSMVMCIFMNDVDV